MKAKKRLIAAARLSTGSDQQSRIQGEGMGGRCPPPPLVLNKKKSPADITVTAGAYEALAAANSSLQVSMTVLS